MCPCVDGHPTTDTKDVNRIQNVLSNPPGDFAGFARGLYLTKQRQTAFEKKRLSTADEDSQLRQALGITLAHLHPRLTLSWIDEFEKFKDDSHSLIRS